MPSYSYFHVNRVPVLLRFVASGWIVAIGLLVGSLTQAAEQAEIDFFESKIRPVLVRHCYECHSAEGGEVKGGLRLDTRDAIRRGGDSGPAVVPGDVDGSLLIDAVRYESFEMPPTGRLPDHVVADLTKWIEAGAADPREETSPTTNVAESSKPKIDFAEARQFWSFQRPSRHEPPHVEQTDWIRRPIDAFVLARMETASLSPNAQADRRTLVRRLSFDLLGLPPTPEEVAAFEADDSPRAYERLVERLLASPRFGERWARLWLDVARYAEDQAHIVGNNKELFYPNAYKYRDWVIQAFNQDLPYDQFVRLQLAADLIDDDPANDVALGFIGLGPKYYRRNAPEVMADEWEDRVDTVGRGLLGLTVACARCHDHKYDPIPTEDYYALAGVFAGTQMFNRPMDAERETKNGGEAKNPDESFHVVRDDKPTDLAVMIRGDVNNRGPVVPRRFLQVLCDGEPTPFQDGSGRRELAESIASTDNPLTARVIVNRVWGQYFGSPLVSTASNFGALGQRPTHPELLDDLAARFMENGWSLKRLHREIVMSATYQQSSQAEAAKVAADPANQWLARMPRRRLSVESWRDAVLSAGGSLSDVIGGQSVDPTAINAKSDAGQRRTVYSEVSRFQLHPLLAMFDFPDPNAHSGGRVETTTPLQKLFVLNSPWMVEQARRLAERTATDVAAKAEAADDEESAAVTRDDAARIDRAYRLLFGREPEADELRLGLAYLTTDNADDHQLRWQEFAQLLLATNELLILD